MKVLRKPSITLIEILIVMTLLAVLGGVVGISTSRAIRQQQYAAGVAQMVDRLQLAQDIMLIAKGDVRVHITQESNGVAAHLEVTQPLLPALQKLVDRSGIIPGIGAFAWTEPSSHTLESRDVWLEFKSDGTRMTRGELRLTAGALNDPGSNQNFILLPGRPEPFMETSMSRLSKLDTGLATDLSLDRLYPIEVTAALEQIQP